MARPYLIALAGSVALIASVFLPWLTVGDVGVPGVPDPAGYFVLGVGIAALLLSGAGSLARGDMRGWLMLAGLAGLTTLVVVWLTGPTTVADRALARAEAIAIVDNVAVQPVPPVRVGVGLVLGVVGAAVVAVVGIAGMWAAERAAGRDVA
ncbi:MAG: hypothetical protein QM736_16410 [Vicinamibacterales bacterium]